MVDMYQHKLVLVTGGSSGIGLAIARQLAQRGAHVWIAARGVLRLEAAHKLINLDRASSDQRTGIIPVNLCDSASAHARLAAFQADAGVPDLLVNCAGVAHPGLVHETSLDIFREQMDGNYFTTVNATAAVLGGMISRGSGQIINFASAAALGGMPGYAAYGASKFAVRCYSDVLRVEMKPKGITVSIVFPTDVDTPQLAYENQYKPQLTLDVEAQLGVTKPGRAEDVARIVLDQAARRKYIILPGGDAKFLFFLVNLLGTGIYPLGDMLVRRALKPKR
jgi:3-dehydrosphinganine reductase